METPARRLVLTSAAVASPNGLAPLAGAAQLNMRVTPLASSPLLAQAARRAAALFHNSALCDNASAVSGRGLQIRPRPRRALRRELRFRLRASHTEQVHRRSLTGAAPCAAPVLAPAVPAGGCANAAGACSASPSLAPLVAAGSLAAGADSLRCAVPRSALSK